MTELELKVKAFMDTTPFLMENGIVIDEVTKDGAVLRCKVRDNQKNPYGMIHGGLLFTIQDCCCGATARADGRRYVTQNSTINYLSSGRGGEITARSKVIKRGRSSCVIETEVTDEQGRLLSGAVTTMFCLGEDQQFRDEGNPGPD